MKTVKRKDLQDIKTTTARNKSLRPHEVFIHAASLARTKERYTLEIKTLTDRLKELAQKLEDITREEAAVLGLVNPMVVAKPSAPRYTKPRTDHSSPHLVAETFKIRY